MLQPLVDAEVVSASIQARSDPGTLGHFGVCRVFFGAIISISHHYAHLTQWPYTPPNMGWTTVPIMVTVDAQVSNL
ncbi:hypothetical protein ACJZ2D_013280 [Fusarium nematophilum]